MNEKIARIIEIQKELDLRKELYSELDELTLQLQRDGFISTEFQGLTIELVDNFKVGNTVFRPAGVKRFELKIKKVKGG